MPSSKVAAGAKAPSLVYQEPTLVVRLIREEFTKEYRGVLIDDRDLYEEVRAYIEAHPGTGYRDAQKIVSGGGAEATAATAPEPVLVAAASSDSVQDPQVTSSLDRLSTLKTVAMSGATTAGLSLGLTRNVTTADWLRANSAPNMWPVEGPITGSFGERIDPFNGEGAFHSGVDIGSAYGQPVVAPAEAVVEFADFLGGYGRAITLDHGHGITTRYGHLASFAVFPGQHVHRGDTIGYVGDSGRSTGPHLHYEVRINDVPVNPHKYLRVTYAHVGGFAAGS